MLQAVLSKYGFENQDYTIEIFGSGLINNTWKITREQDAFILQRINTSVFKNPVTIANNIRMIADYLQIIHPEYLFVTPTQTLDGEDLVHDPSSGYYRLMPFIKNSHTVDVVQTPMQAYEAAKQFGKFTKSLSEFDCSKLKITLPDFHNLSLRYQQFEEALQKGNKERILESNAAIEFIEAHKSLVDIFDSIRKNPLFRTRVTHHDTKISNVLFNNNQNALCVIDLDTVMPGYFISDVGDMMRTYLSPVSEEEKEFKKIEIREHFFKAIVQGYLSEMGDELADDERAHFVYAGKFMIYMQAIRFLADYLNNDVYYGSKYEGHNFVRANNQIVLLQRLMEKEQKLQEMVLQFHP